MTERAISLADVYSGWDNFEANLVKAVASLTPEQLALPIAPTQWPIGTLVQHIITDRIWWFHLWMGEGSPELLSLMNWDDEGQVTHTAAELVSGLEATWEMVAATLARWTVNDLGQVFAPPSDADPERFEPSTRQEIIFHILRHDIHHGGELALGMGGYDLDTIWRF